ncbi:MAG: hypothetical protein ABF807_08375 [Liquorilactobacillus nagelii]|jgi:O-antigen/teichoic acid export membrane protein|uniref:hypothetical protein n=1 Tax=Liquorilactobacillus nagelii TaxID=82688 RepID=UPI0039ECE839
MNNDLKKNFTFAFIAQGLSLVMSCLTNLILPKVITPLEFSYWQLFIFYATYIPCFALGLNDGVYLRYGGALRKKINFKSVKSQYFFGLIFQFTIAIIIGVTAFFLIDNNKRKLIVFWVLIYYLVYTCHNFLGYTFQALNETNIFSKSIIIDRVFYASILCLIIVIKKANVFLVIPFYIAGIFVAWLYLFHLIQSDFKKVPFDLELGIKESIVSMKTGISLMISNICSLLVLGVGRQIVETKWGLLTFGKVSFSLTLINFALTFISQIGMVLFPALRRLDRKALNEYYIKLNIALFNFLPIIYILYLPAQYILKLWLPNYRISIDYLSVILPICFFDGKMNLIGNTFFKVLRKQVTLLKINVATILISCFWGLIAAYIFNSLYSLVIGLVFAIGFRCVISSFILSKITGNNSTLMDILDVVLAVIFVFSTTNFQWYSSLIIISTIYLIRFIFSKRENAIYKYKHFGVKK